MSERPGAVALVGSGEYTPAMIETDTALLHTRGEASTVRVAVLPTAAGLEDPASPARWARMGLDHFTALGAPVQAAMILNRNDAHDERWLPVLEEADFYYFSGGNPQHVVETMRDSPAWAIITRRHAQGAILAGCSAGAMMMGGYTAGMRALMGGSGVGWQPALGVLPHIITMPHFDRMANFVGKLIFTQLTHSAPKGTVLVGVDEDTALVRLDPPAEDGSMVRWQVMGNQTVSVFDGAGKEGKTVYTSGQIVLLPGA